MGESVHEPAVPSEGVQIAALTAVSIADSGVRAFRSRSGSTSSS
jgi:hypothetical protein